MSFMEWSILPHVPVSTYTHLKQAEPFHSLYGQTKTLDRQVRQEFAPGTGYTNGGRNCDSQYQQLTFQCYSLISTLDRLMQRNIFMPCSSDLCYGIPYSQSLFWPIPFTVCDGIVLKHFRYIHLYYKWDAQRYSLYPNSIYLRSRNRKFPNKLRTIDQI